jgi:hypothetical protein
MVTATAMARATATVRASIIETAAAVTTTIAAAGTKDVELSVDTGAEMHVEAECAAGRFQVGGAGFRDKVV